VSTFFTTILGTMGAMLLGKYRFRGRELFQNLLYVPVILPEIIFGVALLALFMLIRFPLGMTSIICGHITFSFPFATLIILAKVNNLPPALEEASLDLGANRWQTFFRVILPNISPGVVSGALFAFTLSIDDFIVTFFTAGVGSSTLPLKIYSLIKYGITPSINAISTILIVFTVLALVLADRLQKSERIGKKVKLAIGGLFLLIILGLIVVPLFSGRQQKLHIYNFSTYLDDSLIADFEKETGIEVSLDYYNDNEELLSRLQMGVGGYDLIFPSGYMVKIMKSRGLIAPIDFRNIPNYRHINPVFRKLSYDTTGKYYIPYAYGFTAIVYNSDLIRDSIDSWNAMWDERYRENILMLDDMREVFWATYRMMGMTFDSDTVKLQKALEMLIKQKPLLKKYESNATQEMMLSGDVWIAQTWNGLIARLNGIDKKFRLCWPKEGVTFFVDNVCIPSTSPHKKNAEKFLNFLLDPAHSARNMQVIRYAMPNEAARMLLDDELRNSVIIFPEINDPSQLEVMHDMGEFNKRLDRAWTELKVK
jgi:spermidine/putrescine transport system permease protein